MNVYQHIQCFRYINKQTNKKWQDYHACSLFILKQLWILAVIYNNILQFKVHVLLCLYPFSCLSKILTVCKSVVIIVNLASITSSFSCFLFPVTYAKSLFAKFAFKECFINCKSSMGTWPTSFFSSKCLFTR